MNWFKKDDEKKKRKLEKKFFTKIMKKLEENKKATEKLETEENKKKALIKDIVQIRDEFEMIDLENDLSGEELSTNLMQLKLEEVVSIYEDIIKVLEKKIGEY